MATSSGVHPDGEDRSSNSKTLGHLVPDVDLCYTSRDIVDRLRWTSVLKQQQHVYSEALEKMYWEEENDEEEADERVDKLCNDLMAMSTAKYNLQTQLQQMEKMYERERDLRKAQEATKAVAQAKIAGVIRRGHSHKLVNVALMKSLRQTSRLAQVAKQRAICQTKSVKVDEKAFKNRAIFASNIEQQLSDELDETRLQLYQERLQHQIETEQLKAQVHHFQDLMKQYEEDNHQKEEAATPSQSGRWHKAVHQTLQTRKANDLKREKLRAEMRMAMMQRDVVHLMEQSSSLEKKLSQALHKLDEAAANRATNGPGPDDTMHRSRKVAHKKETERYVPSLDEYLRQKSMVHSSRSRVEPVIMNIENRVDELDISKQQLLEIIRFQANTEKIEAANRIMAQKRQAAALYS